MLGNRAMGSSHFADAGHLDHSVAAEPVSRGPRVTVATVRHDRVARVIVGCVLVVLPAWCVLGACKPGAGHCLTRRVQSRPKTATCSRPFRTLKVRRLRASACRSNSLTRGSPRWRAQPSSPKWMSTPQRVQIDPSNFIVGYGLDTGEKISAAEARQTFYATDSDDALFFAIRADWSTGAGTDRFDYHHAIGLDTFDDEPGRGSVAKRQPHPLVRKSRPLLRGGPSQRPNGCHRPASRSTERDVAIPAVYGTLSGVESGVVGDTLSISARRPRPVRVPALCTLSHI